MAASAVSEVSLRLVKWFRRIRAANARLQRHVVTQIVKEEHVLQKTMQLPTASTSTSIKSTLFTTTCFKEQEQVLVLKVKG